MVNVECEHIVSIPFRADTGFERRIPKIESLQRQNVFQSLSGLTLGLNVEVCWWVNDAHSKVSIPFRADTGFERRKRQHDANGKVIVSIPFRADTGFEQYRVEMLQQVTAEFQSLSGLTLGLNSAIRRNGGAESTVSIPFRADTGFEQKYADHMVTIQEGFQSLSGLTLGLNSLTFREMDCWDDEFQSLSGLTLGLNKMLWP